MFKKKPNIKPLAPLRSSDRRRTADQIISDLDIALPVSSTPAPSSTPTPTTPAPSDEDAAATARTTLRNRVLPENALSARFTTTQGPELRPVSGTVYVGDDAQGVQRVLWISFENTFYPTVYTLWKNPSICPLLHCGSNVVTRLQGGADLMTPGLIYGPPFPEKARKGAVVAIAGHLKKSVPVVVGRCVVDVAGLGETAGMKGVAVETVHWMGDEVWKWGREGGEPPDEIEEWLPGQMKDVEDGVGELALDDDQEGGVALTGDNIDGEDARSEAQDAAAPEQQPDKDYTTAELDDVFLAAFLYGINHHKSLYPSSKTHGLDLPLTQTVVMSTLVNPFLPAFTPHDTTQMVIKKTSWKNIRKFIKYLDKRRIVKSKDRDGNEAVIVDVDFDDAAVLSFKPYRLPKKDAPAATHNGAGQSSEDNAADPSLGQTLKVLALYKPKPVIAPLFATSAKEADKQFYTSAEIKAAVASYVEAQSLVIPNNKRLVTLDPFLANSVLSSDSSSSSKAGPSSSSKNTSNINTTAIEKEALARGTIPRDILAERVLAGHCAPFHVILRNPTSSSQGNQKPTPGSPPKITITLETRSGNKTVTKIQGLESYFIPPVPLSEELRKVCAGSTSVERVQGSSPKDPKMEVMVQGPQRAAVEKALQKRGVDLAKWVEVVDKTKGKKGR